MTRPTSIDYERGTVSIPRRLMPPLLAAHSGTCNQSALMELSNGGLMVMQQLDPFVRGLVDIVTDPDLVVSVETRDATRRTEPARLTTVWRRERKAVLGQVIGGNDFELVRVEPALLPFHVAQAVGMSPHRQPSFEGSVSIPPGLLNRADDLLSLDTRDLDVKLTASGLERKWADRLLAAVTLRRRLWTIDSVSLLRERSESRLCVLDAGFAGLWRLTSCEQGTTTIGASNFDDAMRRITALLP